MHSRRAFKHQTVLLFNTLQNAQKLVLGILRQALINCCSPIFKAGANPCRHPRFTITTAHLLSFHRSPMSPIVACTSLNTTFTLASQVAQTFRSSTYKRSMIFALVGFDRRQPSDACNFQAMGFIHNVNNFGQRASPCGSPLANKMRSDNFVPCLVLTEILVFHLAPSLFIRFPIYYGKQCMENISLSQLWDTESYNLRTSIQAMLMLRRPR